MFANFPHSKDRIVRFFSSDQILVEKSMFHVLMHEIFFYDKIF